MDNQVDTSQEETLNRWYEARKRVVNELLPNLDKAESLGPEQKFDVYLTALQYTHDPELIDKAVNTAKNITDISAQNDALLTLLQEINYSINLIGSPDEIDNQR